MLELPMTRLLLAFVSAALVLATNTTAAAAAAAAANATIENIQYKAWLRGGDTQNMYGEPLNWKGLAFLQAYDAKGNGVYSVVPAEKSYLIASDPDFTSILKTPMGRIFTISSFEYTMPSGQYISELHQDKATGQLSALNTHPVDWSKWGGIITPCAGSQSPWGSHMAGEEVCPDARAFEAATSFATLGAEIADRAVDYARYWGLYNVSKTQTLPNGIVARPVTFAAFKSYFNPYKYGFALEIRVTSQGRTFPRKLYTLGRTNVEAPICMPDQKTCYLSDDSKGGAVQPKFVATNAGDLSSGTLYAAKLTQTGQGTYGGAFSVKWIKLASGTQTELEALINSGIKFSNIFSVATPTSLGACPAKFKSVNTAAGGLECLKLKAGMEKAAAFLETRRYAAYVGATTEINRSEGIDIDPSRRMMYFAVTSVSNGMEANSSYDLGGPNHVKVTDNICGCVYAATLDANWSMTTMRAIVCGKEVDPATNNGQACDVNSIASPDNLALIKGTNTLVIYEDTDYHTNNMLWALDVTKGVGSLTRIMTATAGAEMTSGNYVRDVNGWDYLVAVVQHPYSDLPELAIESESQGPAAYVGYMGPFPTASFKGGVSLQFNEVPVASQVNIHRNPSSNFVSVN